MNGKDISDDLFERYLSDSLNAEERDAFEKEMAENPVLREEVALHKDVPAGIDLHFDHELKKQLQAVEHDIKMENQTTKDTPGYKWILCIASSLILIITGIYFVVNQSLSSEEKFVSYYHPYPNIVSPAERSGEVSSANITALDLYEQGNYAAAIEAFEKNQQETINNSSLRFYYALSLLSLGNSNDAIPHLMELSQLPEHNFLINLSGT